MEQHVEQRIVIREVTQIQASWTETVRGEPGAFTLQLILDNGADEYVLRPTAEDTGVLLQLINRSNKAVFDLERKVLIFGNLSIDVD